MQMTGALILYRNVYLLVALASMFRLQQSAGKVWTQFHHKSLHVNNIMHRGDKGKMIHVDKMKQRDFSYDDAIYDVSYSN